MEMFFCCMWVSYRIDGIKLNFPDLIRVLSKSKRVNFHSFKQDNTFLSGKQLWKGESAISIKISILYGVKNSIPHSFESEILPLKNVLSSI